jgi:hypothetical protein
VLSKKVLRNQKGLGLVEVVVSLAILLMISIGASLIMTSIRNRNADFSGTTDCHNLTAGITGTIRSYENALVVRNWLPRRSTDFAAAQVTQDPFCSSSGGRTPICDTFALFQNLDNGNYLDPQDTKNFQNIRGAFTWAQSLYNQNRNKGICKEKGLQMDSEKLRNLLPTQISLPGWVLGYFLYVKDADLPCEQESTSMRATMELTITARYLRHPEATIPNECTSTIKISNPNDTYPPTLKIAGVQNLDGGPILDGQCSDRRTVPDILKVGGIGVNWQTVFIDFDPIEPGSILSCRKDGAFEQDEPGKVWNCPDMQLLDGATVELTPNENTISFNQPLQARIRMSNLRDRGQEMHIYGIKAIDVGGNESNTAVARFRVHTPQCIPRDEYCSIAQPANPPSAAFQGIFVQPFDDCLNGPCPQGTHSICDDNKKQNTCKGTFFDDDCGQQICEGLIEPTCVGVDVSQVPCGTNVSGICGASCPGAMGGCGSPPTPVPGCNCNAVNVATLACDTFAADSCGNAGACGPGTKDCTTLPPWSWGPDMFAVDESSSKTTTKTYNFPAGVIPTGYSRYELDINVIGMSDREASRITVTVNLGSSTFSKSGGPYYPIDKWVNFFSGTVSFNGPNPPSMSITVSVTETFSKTYFTLRGIP